MGTALRSNGHPIGTQGFAAPDFLQGKYAHKVDVYSLGVTALYLLEQSTTSYSPHRSEYFRRFVDDCKKAPESRPSIKA